MNNIHPCLAAPDSGCDSSEDSREFEFDDDKMMMQGVKKPDQRQGGRGGQRQVGRGEQRQGEQRRDGHGEQRRGGRGRARYVPPKKDEEEFITRQIQEVLSPIGGDLTASAPYNKRSQPSKTPERHDDDDMGNTSRGIKPRNRGRGGRLKDRVD